MQITKEEIDHEWDHNVMPSLCNYIEVPNMSPAFDKDWENNGHIDKAMNLVYEWVISQKVPTLRHKVYKLPGRTPLLICELPATITTDGNKHKNMLFYGHIDKQPPQTAEWSEGLHPYKAIIKNGKLYGRGGADDGYAVFSTITIFKLLKRYNVPHGRLLLLIEASEESGSPDLPTYVDLLTDAKSDFKIGEPDLIVCLDSGCSDYKKFWLTTSLKGVVNMDLQVTTMKQSKHSGTAGGVVPEPFNIMREVISRLVDYKGQFSKQFYDHIDPDLLSIIDKYPQTFVQTNLKSEFSLLDNIILNDSPETLLFNNVWNPTFTLIGTDGLPHKNSAGNAIQPTMTFRFSMRVPPFLKAAEMYSIAKHIIEKDPPYNASITLTSVISNNGWLMPYDEKLITLLKDITKDDMGFKGEGGTIPFMNMLSNKFPKAKFIVTGVLGPESNAHSCDESLDLDYVKQLTHWMALLVCRYQ